MATAVPVSLIGPVYKGENATIPFRMTDGTDITGWTLRFLVKANRQTATPVLLDVAVSITDPIGGLFQATLDQAATVALASGTFVWDVWRLDVGFEGPVALGTLVVVDDPRFGN